MKRGSPSQPRVGDCGETLADVKPLLPVACPGSLIPTQEFSTAATLANRKRLSATIRRMTNFGSVIRELKAERDRIDQALTILSSLNGSGQPRSAGSRGRTMSAAARARISQAQKARWAKSRGQAKITPISAGRGKRKGTISAAGLARIRAAQRARWAKVRAAKKK